MDGRRLKTIVILILAAVNLFFLGIIISERLQSRGMESREKEEMASVLRNSGIELSQDSIPDGKALERCNIVRDGSQEKNFAIALIGDTEPEEQGGGIVFYESELGWARFRAGGDLEAVIYDKSGLPALTDAIDYVASLLSGLDMKISDGVLQSSWNGTEVFNCTLTAKVSDDGIHIEGKRLSGTPGGTGETSEVSSYTALMVFLRRTISDGTVVNKVYEVSQGYVSLYSASAGTLEPVWQIETDGGTVYVSAMDGRVVEP